MTSDDKLKTIVRMPNWLGDACMALPVIGGLLAEYPHMQVDMLIDNRFAGLGEILPDVGWAWPLPPNRRERAPTLAALRAEAYDAALILPNSFRSAWEMWSIAPRRIGYAGNMRSRLLTQAFLRPDRAELHQSDYFAQLTGSAFERFVPADPRIEIPKDAEELAGELVNDITGKMIGIGFGASFGSAKMWPVDRFATLVDRLSEQATVLLVGAESDREAEQELLALTRSCPISLVGRTDIPTLAALMRRLSCYVTNDTGPMHLAALLGTDVVAIFGSTDPDETAPCGDRVKILHEGADCAPCWKRTCPTDHRCMTALSVETVLAAVIG